MGYVIAAVIVLFLAAGFVTYLVLNATRRSGGAGPADPGAEGSPAGIASPDPSPLGDSAEHAGEHSEGRTVDEPESERSSTAADDGKPRVGDPSDEAPTPESERLA